MQIHSEWFDVRARAAGMFAFMLHRLSGIGLVAYLYLHLFLLNQLQRGPSAWNGFVQSLRSPVVSVLDAILLFGILVHGLNGLRVSLIGFGVLVRHQKSMFWICLGLAVTLGLLGMAVRK